MARTIFRLPRFSALQHVSVLPDVWRMCAFTVCLSFLLCQVYNPIRRAVRDGQKKTLLFYLFHDCDAFFNMCTTFVTFILSFFNATVFTRWWRLRELCGTVNGRTVDTVVLLSAYVSRPDDLDALMRFLWLAHALHVASIDPQLSQDPDEDMAKVLQRMMEDGLLLPSECDSLRHTQLASSTPLSVAYGWFSAKLRQVVERDVPPSMHSAVISLVQTNVSEMRGAAASVLMYLSTPVPLAYTQLLELMVTIYVMMAPLGLVPRLLWMAVPGCFVVTLIFYGFMALGKLMLNPFAAASEDAFDTHAFLRGTRSACRAVADAAFLEPGQAALPPNPTSLLHTEASSVGRSNPVLFDAGADNLLPGARTAKGPLLKGAPASGRDAPPQRGAHAPVPAPRASGGSSDEGKVDRVEEEPDWPVPSGGLRKRETFGPGVSPGSSPWLGPTRTAAAHAKRAQSPSLFYGLR